MQRGLNINESSFISFERDATITLLYNELLCNKTVVHGTFINSFTFYL